MSVLVDSDVVISVLRGRSREVLQLETYVSQDVPVYFSPVTTAEVFAGMRPSEERATQQFFTLLISLGITDEIGQVAGFYLAEYGQSHGMEVADALIAATARQHNLSLWTLNKKHYPMPDIHLVGG